jgi:hypothetical protein
MLQVGERELARQLRERRDHALVLIAITGDDDGALVCPPDVITNTQYPARAAQPWARKDIATDAPPRHRRRLCSPAYGRRTEFAA